MADQKNKEKVVLGIDPGSTIMGYALVEGTADHMKVLAYGVLELQKYKDHFVKLKHIFDRTVSLIDEFKPDELAIESPFYGKNIQSMLKLGRAQGTAISAALSRSLPVFEYAPRKIKMSITGRGEASKEQVATYLKILLHLDDLPKYLDATDALAAAVCHFYQKNIQLPGNNYKSWKEFIAKNPGRVR